MSVIRPDSGPPWNVSGNIPGFQQMLAKYMSGAANTEGLWGLVHYLEEFLPGDKGWELVTE